MYNLPTDSTINGLSVYHEGNHSNKGNPHDNYLSKFSCNYSLNNKSTVDKMFKMCTIRYPINNNVEFKYIIEILSTKIENENNGVVHAELLPDQHNQIEDSLKL